jgi:hypothetical protein
MSGQSRIGGWGLPQIKGRSLMQGNNQRKRTSSWHSVHIETPAHALYTSILYIYPHLSTRKSYHTTLVLVILLLKTIRISPLPTPAPVLIRIEIDPPFLRVSRRSRLRSRLLLLLFFLRFPKTRRWKPSYIPFLRGFKTFFLPRFACATEDAGYDLYASQTSPLISTIPLSRLRLTRRQTYHRSPAPDM